jgi:hypothetical protein
MANKTSGNFIAAYWPLAVGEILSNFGRSPNYKDSLTTAATSIAPHFKNKIIKK